MKKFTYLCQFTLVLALYLLVACSQVPNDFHKQPDLDAYHNDQTVKNRGLKLLSTGKPFYPLSAVKAKKQGWCIAQFDVSADGTTTNIQMLDCNPKGYFEYGCKTMVSEFKYSAEGLPATKVIHLCSFNLRI